MDISYYKSMEPIFGFWRIEKELGKGSFGQVYSIKREDYGETYYSALKVISFPQDPSEEDSLKAEGMDDMSITSYYNTIVEEMVGEFKLMAKLKGNTNIVSYENHMVIDHVNDKGKDILIQMELLTPLNKYIIAKDENDQLLHPLTINNVIKLGIDIGKALELCSEYDIIHRDIKPENIFVTDHGDFKLGDFGVARTVGKTRQAMSMKGTLSYMAPEMYRGNNYDASVDIYALGMVLYRLCNNGRAPFLPPYPEIITHQDKEKSEICRLRGDVFPDAVFSNKGLMNIIRKATAYNPADRYANPSLMRKDLEKLIYMGEQAIDSVEKPADDDTETVAYTNQNAPAAQASAPVVMSPVVPASALTATSPAVPVSAAAVPAAATASPVAAVSAAATASAGSPAPVIFTQTQAAPIIIMDSISSSEDDDKASLSALAAVDEDEDATLSEIPSAGEAVKQLTVVKDLTELEPFESEGIYVSPSECDSYGTDNYGTEYDKYLYGYHPYSDTFAEYNLKNVDCDVLRFTVYLTSRAKKEYDSVLKLNGMQSYIKISCDGKTVFELNDISQKMDPEEYEINISGAKFLRIDFTYSYFTALGMANPVIGKY